MMKRHLIVSLCVPLIASWAGWLSTAPLSAQEGTQDYDDGNFYIIAALEVDDSNNLYVDGYMEVEFDADEDIDSIEVDGDAAEDGNTLAYNVAYGDDDDLAEVSGDLGVVATGHQYEMSSEGSACFDDGEGDCDWESIASVTAVVNLQYPPPSITNLSTYGVTQGDRGTLTVTGANLVQGTGDQLNVDLSNSSAPFTPAGTPTSTTATFSYDFTSYPVGSYTLTVVNNEGESDGVTFTVASQFPAQPCSIGASPKSTYSSFISTATPGGSGTVAVSFSGAAYSAVKQSISYGPYSTPSSVASSIAALITANYKQYGLTARAFGPNIVYGGNSSVGAVNQAITGPSISSTTSSTAASSAANACFAAPPTPPALCGNVNPKYVLAVTYDSVNWIDVGMNYGRNVNYSLEDWPTIKGQLGNPTQFQSTVTEHLSARMAYGVSSSGTHSGLFDDILGNTAAFQKGSYTADRCFTVTSPTLGNLGQVVSYDAAGTHTLDHIVITQSITRSILNNWANADGSPNIEISR